MARYVDMSRVTNGIAQQTLVWLSNDDPQASYPNDAVINQIIADAEDLVDDALRGRYSLPLQNVPTSVGRIALAIARHDLYARRPETPVPEDLRRMYNEAIKGLNAIQAGTLHVGDETQASQPDGGDFHVRAPARIVSDKLLEKY